MRVLKYLRDVATLALDASACIGCGRCVEVCPHEVFVVDERKAVVTDRDRCMECGACARNCPAGALAVESGVGCAIGLLGEYFQERRLVKFLGGGGRCC